MTGMRRVMGGPRGCRALVHAALGAGLSALVVMTVTVGDTSAAAEPAAPAAAATVANATAATATAVEPAESPAAATPSAAAPAALGGPLTPAELVAAFDRLVLPGTSDPAALPPITGDGATDAAIRAAGEARGYRVRAVADVGRLVPVGGVLLQPEAAAAWGRVQSAAAAAGHGGLRLVSGYRSAGDQAAIFGRYLASWGLDRALGRAAVPGYSKHHTGFAVDIAQGGLGGPAFGLSPAYAWLAADGFANARQHGFLPSYPPGAGPQGPDAEPWELVYAGTEAIRCAGPYATADPSCLPVRCPRLAATPVPFRFRQPDCTSLGVPLSPVETVDVDHTPSGRGYWVTTAGGVVRATNARHAGHGPTLRAGELVVALEPTPTERGYWLFTTAGRVFPYGDARHRGDVTTVLPPGQALRLPIVDAVATASGRGYLMVATDGGVFGFGDGRFQGSLPGVLGGRLPDAAVVGIAMAPGGYWLVGADGGIFTFGRIGFHGSVPGVLGGRRLDAPVAGMVASPAAGGYFLVGADGGVFTFGAAPFLGSLGGTGPRKSPIAALSPSPRDRSYLLVDAVGTTRAFR